VPPVSCTSDLLKKTQKCIIFTPIYVKVKSSIFPCACHEDIWWSVGTVPFILNLSFMPHPHCLWEEQFLVLTEKEAT
jgi:hypothetical protein